ncbi:hypothetical protein [Amycolatopsis japonica]
MRKLGDFLKEASTVEPFALDIDDEEGGPLLFHDPRDITAEEVEELRASGSIKFTMQHMLRDDFARGWQTLKVLKERELADLLDEIKDYFRDHDLKKK